MYANPLMRATTKELIATGNGTINWALWVSPGVMKLMPKKASKKSATNSEISHMRRYQNAEMAKVVSPEFISGALPFTLLTLIML
jgi:hypothetical protein